MPEYQFLSDEWFDAARRIGQEYAGGIPTPAEPVRINQVVTGVPFGDGEVRLFVDTSSGPAIMEKGQLEAADVTVTFHRPKQGLRTRIGRALAGKVLVAPIGIPPEADPA